MAGDGKRQQAACVCMCLAHRQPMVFIKRDARETFISGAAVCTLYEKGEVATEKTLIVSETK
jgi:hypothetical protein